MENDFWISVSLPSFGGNLDLMVIPSTRSYAVFLDGQELCRLKKDKELSWHDLNISVGGFTAEVIGAGIDLYYLGKENLVKKAV